MGEKDTSTYHMLNMILRVVFLQWSLLCGFIHETCIPRSSSLSFLFFSRSIITSLPTCVASPAISPSTSYFYISIWHFLLPFLLFPPAPSLNTHSFPFFPSPTLPSARPPPSSSGPILMPCIILTTWKFTSFLHPTWKVFNFFIQSLNIQLFHYIS